MKTPDDTTRQVDHAGDCPHAPLRRAFAEPQDDYRIPYRPPGRAALPGARVAEKLAQVVEPADLEHAEKLRREALDWAHRRPSAGYLGEDWPVMPEDPNYSAGALTAEGLAEVRQAGLDDDYRKSLADERASNIDMFCGAVIGMLIGGCLVHLAHAMKWLS